MANSLEHARHLNSKYGFNCIPLFYFKRDGANKLVAGYSQANTILYDTPGAWKPYQTTPYPLDSWPADAQNLAILTGETSNLTIVDIDSLEAFTSLQNTLNMSLEESCNYVVRTNKGYQFFYKFEPGLRPRKGVEAHIDLLAQGRLSYADSINIGYTVLKDGQPGEMPEKLKEFFLDRDNVKLRSFNQFLQEEHPLTYKNPLALLLEEYLDSAIVGKNLAAKLVKVFATGDYAGWTFKDMKGMKKGLHNFMMHVAGITASNPTVDEELHYKFNHEFYARTMKGNLSPKELDEECLDASLQIFEYNPNWADRAQSEASLENAALEANLKVWFNPASEKYYRFNLTTGELDGFAKSHFLDRFKADTGRVVDVADVPEIRHRFEPSINAEFYKDDTTGKEVYNEFKRTELMEYFLVCKPRSNCPPFLDALVGNVFPHPEHRHLFEHNLAYHLRYLTPCMTAIISIGKTQGTGKNTLYDGVLGAIYGKYHLSWNTAKFTGGFNGDLRNKLVVHGNDISEKLHQYSHTTMNNTLKTMVGGWPLSITAKGKETEMVENHLFVVLSSNEAKPFTSDEGDNRRLNVFPTHTAKLEEAYPQIANMSKMDITRVIQDEIMEYLEYLASIPLREPIWGKAISTPQRGVIVDRSTSSAHKIAQALLDKNMTVIEEECPDEFAEFFRKEFIQLNISYLKVQTLKEYLPAQRKQITDYFKACGVEGGLQHIPRERKTGVVYIINPKGVKEETLLSPKL